MRILAIDPGTMHSGYVIYDREAHQVLESNAARENFDLLHYMNVAEFTYDVVAVERFAAMGMAIGESSIATIMFTGRLLEAADMLGVATAAIKRAEVKLHLCGSARAKDKNVAAAVWDRFGGDRKTAKGTKKAPGPCYGVSGHAVQALAVAITYEETR